MTISVTTMATHIFRTPAVIQDVLFVREWGSRKSVGVECRRIRDVLALPTDDGATVCRINLEADATVFCVDNPAIVRQMWLAWATDNLRFTTEVNRG